MTVLFPDDGTFCVAIDVKLALEEVALSPLLVQVTINCHNTVVPKAGAVAQ